MFPSKLIWCAYKGVFTMELQGKQSYYMEASFWRCTMVYWCDTTNFCFKEDDTPTESDHLVSIIVRYFHKASGSIYCLKKREDLWPQKLTLPTILERFWGTHTLWLFNIANWKMTHFINRWFTIAMLIFHEKWHISWKPWGPWLSGYLPFNGYFHRWFIITWSMVNHNLGEFTWLW
jgi:hypothetical protein